MPASLFQPTPTRPLTNGVTPGPRAVNASAPARYFDSASGVGASPCTVVSRAAWIVVAAEPRTSWPETPAPAVTTPSGSTCAG
jgi:hypothetical protein